MTTLPLSSIANVVYNLPASGGTRSGFNLGLIIGESNVISAGDRVVVYSSLQEMTDDGFATNAPEYLAAQVYFAANGRPAQVAIGRWATGETAVEAVSACRAANTEWYGCYLIGADNAEHLLVAAYIEALADNYSQYFINSDDADVLADTAGNVLEDLNTAGYRRTHFLYSTTDHAVCSVMGYAMSNTLDAAASVYTLKFKTLPGVTVDVLTTQQVADIEANKGNVYIQRGAFYEGYENGTQVNGDYFDEIIGLDKLVNDIQISIANLLYQTPSIPQTEAGMAQLKSVVGAACERSKVRGFIAPGTWNGLPVLSLQTGDYLPNGYLVQSDKIADQAQADREARIAPNIYAAVKLAGSVHSVFVQVNVNR